jgi:periplasmic copper chaperone A
MCVVALLFPQFITQSLAQTAAARVGELTVTQAWSRPTPPAATVGAVYFSISNMGSKADLLLAVSSPIAARVELHDSRNVRGVVEMRELTSVPCPAGASVVSEPGGLHVMLIGLNRPLTAGAAFPLSLRFRDAGILTLQIPVVNRE